MSNAGAFTDEIKELFKEFPPYSVAVTLYGGTNATYRKITGVENGLDKVLENIEFLQSIRVPVSINYTMIKQNVFDYPMVADICKQLGIGFSLITDITAHSRDKSFSDALSCRLSPAQRACVACHNPDEVGLAMQ